MQLRSAIIVEKQISDKITLNDGLSVIENLMGVSLEKKCRSEMYR
jgi:hypothetical protein